MPWLFECCKCGACGLTPITGGLAFELADGRWHKKRLDFDEGRVLRPSREQGMAVFDVPPQTVREAMDMGLIDLRLDCSKCHCGGYVPSYKLKRRGRALWFIRHVYQQAI